MASEREMFLIAVYVDDILLAERSNERLTAVKLALSEKFQVKDLGELQHFLGVKVIQDHIHKEYIMKIWYGKCQDS